MFCALFWVSCAINKGSFFEIAFVVVVVIDTHLPRFEVLAYVLSQFDALTHLVIRVSSAFTFQTFAEVCYSVFVNRSSFKSVLNLRKAYIFKSLLKVYYRSVFNESSKAFIFQKCAESLHPEHNFTLDKAFIFFFIFTEQRIVLKFLGAYLCFYFG